MVDIPSAISSLGTLADMAKTAHGLLKSADTASLRLSLIQTAIDAQHALLAEMDDKRALEQTARDLEAELVRMKDWHAERERYELVRLHPGSLVFAQKADVNPAQPLHYLCAHCVGNDKKSILQPTEHRTGGGRVHICPACSCKVLIED